MTTVLLTGAGGSASANVLDALGRADSTYSAVGADTSPLRLHLSLASRRCILPRADDPRYLDAVVHACRLYAVDVIWAQPDPEVPVLGAARDALPAATFLPSQSALEIARDKQAFTDAMAREGVPVPAHRHFDDLRSVAAETEEMLADHERAWVRARVGAGARGSLPVSTGAQAEAWVRWWVSEKGLSPRDFMVSEFLPGPEYAFQSVWQNGALVAGQARERVEYLYGHLTPSGQTSTPAIARTVCRPEVDATAQAAIRALDPVPHGVYCVDIKTGTEGVVKVTEINAGRFFTTSNFFAAAGLNMPDMAMQAALGETLTPVGSSPLPADLYWIRMVDMGFALVPGDELDRWPRPGA